MTLATAVQTSWRGFLETFEPLRADLYRYCRYLTRSAWDAEDLAQDTLARAFVTLGKLGESPPNPKAWLFRVASNLWIDQQRTSEARSRTDAAPPSRNNSYGGSDDEAAPPEARRLNTDAHGMPI